MIMEKMEPKNYLGKKVFFLYLHNIIQAEMLSELINHEYEVYLLPDHTKVKSVINQYPDSIVFINIDEGLREDEWAEYIDDLQRSMRLSGIKIGVLTTNDDPDVFEKFATGDSVPCGIVKLSFGSKESIEAVLRILAEQDARGRRKFLRCQCHEDSATFKFKDGERYKDARVLNISSVGMACTFPDEVDYKSRTVLTDIQLKLKGVVSMVNAVVMGTGTDESGRTIYILLFDSKTSYETKQKIRQFVQQNLQTDMESEVRRLVEKAQKDGTKSTR